MGFVNLCYIEMTAVMRTEDQSKTPECLELKDRDIIVAAEPLVRRETSDIQWLCQSNKPRK